MSSITIAAALSIVVATLLVFAVLALWHARREKRANEAAGGTIDSKDLYLSARGTQGALNLTWSFFASGIGSWILYSLPEVGTFAGALGVAGYTLGNVLPILVLAVIGPKLRRMLGDGVTWTDYVRYRYDQKLQRYVALISIFYGFIFEVAEMTGVGQLINMFSPDTPIVVPIVLLAVATTCYTVIGGLPATIATDRYQGVLCLVLMVLAAVAMLVHVEIPDLSETAALSKTGLEAFIALVLAIPASNFFLTGYWQRVWAADNDRALVIGCLGSSVLITMVSVLLGVIGMVAITLYPDIYPSMAFFEILATMGEGWNYVVLILTVALVASSVDTIQSAIAAEISQNLRECGVTLLHARLLTFILSVPAVILALQQADILTLFLIADLLATATVAPIMLGFWPKSNRHCALLGCLAGILSVMVQGWAITGTIEGGPAQILLPDGLYSSNTMWSFIISLCASTLVTVVGSAVFPEKRSIVFGREEGRKSSFMGMATPSERQSV